MNQKCRTLAFLCTALLLLSSGTAYSDSQYVVICYESERRGAYSEAIAACTKALGESGISVSMKAFSLLNRGAAYFELQQYQRAHDDFCQAIEIKPDYAQAYAGRAYTYMILGKSDLAKADAKKALQLDPTSKVPAF